MGTWLASGSSSAPSVWATLTRRHAYPARQEALAGMTRPVKIGRVLIMDLVLPAGLTRT